MQTEALKPITLQFKAEHGAGGLGLPKPPPPPRPYSSPRPPIVRDDPGRSHSWVLEEREGEAADTRRVRHLVLHKQARWKVRQSLIRTPIVSPEWGGAIPGSYPRPLSYDPGRRIPPLLAVRWGSPPFEPSFEQPEPPELPETSPATILGGLLDSLGAV